VTTDPPLDHPLLGSTLVMLRGIGGRGGGPVGVPPHAETPTIAATTTSVHGLTICEQF